jgi:hypothetical protein
VIDAGHPTASSVASAAPSAPRELGVSCMNSSEGPQRTGNTVKHCLVQEGNAQAPGFTNGLQPLASARDVGGRLRSLMKEYETLKVRECIGACTSWCSTIHLFPGSIYM